MRGIRSWVARGAVAVPVLAVLTACGGPVAVRTPAVGSPPASTAAEPAPPIATVPAAPSRSSSPAARRAPATRAPARTTAPPLPPRTGPRKGLVPRRATPRPTGTVYPPGTWVLRIGAWSRPVVYGDQSTIDQCRAAVLFSGPDPLDADGYAMRTTVIVGHDYCGFDKLAPLPVGTRVTLDVPQGTLTYRVYANYIEPGQGGPDNGLYWGDLTLQTCVGPDTAFSYLSMQ